MNRIYKICLLLVFTFFLSNCKDSGNQVNYQIPNVPVSLNINLNLPLYLDLQTQGSFKFFNGGYKGIIVVHDFDDTYKAFDRACTYNSTLDCSFLQLDTGRLQFKCGTFTGGLYKECCESRFFYNGQINKGPAELPLKPYRVTKSGNTLQVVN